MVPFNVSFSNLSGVGTYTASRHSLSWRAPPVSCTRQAALALMIFGVSKCVASVRLERVRASLRHIRHF